MSGRISRSRLAAVATAVVLSFSGAAQAQFSASAFTPYNPANASSIVPGLTALYSIPVDSLIPTQINVGDAETFSKANGFNLDPNAAALNADLMGEVEPVVIGPNGQLYQTDGHHTFVGLEQSIYGASNPTVYVQVIANYSNLTPAQFANAMAQATQLYPFDNGVQKPVTQVGSNLISPIPTSLAGLTNDPYRGLEYSVLKNKEAGGVGHDKTPGYTDFMWADLYRTAPGTAGGSGLPYLTPADASKAAQWSLVGTNTGTLPGLGTVSVNQMAGFILPSTGSINVTGQITNGNLGTGAIDGSNSGSVTTPSMTGINGYTTNGIVVQPHVTGLLMQLGADNGGTVTLSNTNNTYSGGTTITAGTLIIAGDSNTGGSLGAASTGALPVSNGLVTACAGGNNYSGCVDNAVRATNGIVFESLTEGNGTLQFGTTTNQTVSTNRNISIGQEIANIALTSGSSVTLSGNIVTPNLNTGGAAPLVTSNVTGSGNATLSLTGNNTAFYGNIEIGKNTTVQVASAQSLGVQSGSFINQLEIDDGTFKAGGSFTAAQGVLMHGSVGTFDTNGYSTTWAGGLTDVQRTLKVINNGSTAGSVTFSSMTIGASAALELSDGSGSGSSGDTSVTLTNGITREANATLFLEPVAGSLGGKDKVFSSGTSVQLTNGMVAPWIIEDTGGSASSSPYNFLTYGSTTGYVAATAGSTDITSSTAKQLVIQSTSATLGGAAQAYALQLQSGNTITLGTNTLTLGDGSDPAGLILNNNATITGGTLAFGGSEAVIYAKGTTTPNTIASTITGTGGITLSGSGQLNLTKDSQNTGAIVINSGQLVLDATDGNAISAASGVTLMGTNSSAKPGNAILTLFQSNTVAAINDVNSNSQIFLGGGGSSVTTGGSNGNGIVLTIGETSGANAKSLFLDQQSCQRQRCDDRHCRRDHQGGHWPAGLLTWWYRQRQAELEQLDRGDWRSAPPGHRHPCQQQRDHDCKRHRGAARGGQDHRFRQQCHRRRSAACPVGRRATGRDR